jgi:hypothetical protein
MRDTPLQDRLAVLQERLDRSERQIESLRLQARIVRWLTLAAVAAGATFLATRPAATQGLFTAILQGGTQVKGPLTVVDSSGRPILQVGSSTLGRGMVLYDATGKIICGVGLTSQARGVAVYDGQQKLIAGLGEGSSSDATATGRGLTVFDPAQKVIGTLGMGENGPSHGRGITLNDETGAPVAGLGVWPQRPDRGQLVLTDRNGNPVFSQPLIP